MILSLIVAVDDAGGIGYQGGLPWKLSTDLRRFRSLTIGHHLIMGRRTWQSIGKALPQRVNIIVSTTLIAPPEGCLLADSLPAAIEIARQANESEAFIIGGAQLYAAALPLVDRIYLTRVHAHPPTDVYFPAFDITNWQVKQKIFVPAGQKDEHPSTYFCYQRKVE